MAFQIAGPSFRASSATGSRVLLAGSVYAVSVESGSYLSIQLASPSDPVSRTLLRAAVIVTPGSMSAARSLLTGGIYGVFGNAAGSLQVPLYGIESAIPTLELFTDSVLSSVSFGTQNVIGPVIPPSIASSVAFGATAVIPAPLDIVIAAGIGPGTVVGEPTANAIHIDVDFQINSGVTFGTPTVGRRLVDVGAIESTVSFGDGVVVIDATERAFSVFVGGVDVSKWVPLGIKISNQIGSRGTASFRVCKTNAGDPPRFPAVWDEVVIHHTASGYRLFGGVVESVKRSEATAASSGFYSYDVKCTDYGIMCERRLVAKWYDAFHGSVAGIIAYDLVYNFLDGTGITFAFDNIDASATPVGNDILYNWRRVSEALNDICERGHLYWRIDSFKQLHLFSAVNGYTAAPWSIGILDPRILSFSSSTSKTDFWNSVTVRSSQDLAARWVDTYEAVGAAVIPTTYPTEVKPQIFVDGVEQDEDYIVLDTERSTTSGWQWYYFAGGIGVFPATPVTGSVEIRYPSRTSYVARAEDADSIATYGKVEYLEEAKDISGRTELQELADALLAQGIASDPASATGIEFVTTEPGLEPGQLISVTQPTVSGDFLIEQVDIEQSGSKVDFVTWRVTASNSPEAQRTAAGFVAKLLERDRQPVDRIDSSIAFTLAETIEGIENPGLSVGAKEAFRTARKSGYIKLARLSFKSITDGTPTTSDIEIDVKKNGTSIFSTRKLKLAAGRTTAVEKYNFVEEPMSVEMGDVFTFEVLSADSSAHDGFLELQVVG